MAGTSIQQFHENSDLIDAPKLAKLPAWLQDGLPKLTRHQLKALRATISGHFEFLSLPIELREAIFCSEKSIPITPIADCLTGADKLDVSVLMICKQLYEEASNVLHRTRTAKFYFGAYPDFVHDGEEFQMGTFFGYPRKLNKQEENALVHFRKVELYTVCLSANYLFEYGQPTSGTVGFMLSDWVNLLEQRLKSSPSRAPRDISLNFGLTCGDINLNFERQWTPDWSADLWVRVHLAEAVKQMKKDLKERLPDLSINLRSNVDSETPQIETERQSAFQLRFHHHPSGKSGLMRVPTDYEDQYHPKIVYDKDSE